jgi:hypothetical protein
MRADPKTFTNKDVQRAAQELQKYRNCPEKLINEVDRRCRKKNIPINWRQTGSHVVGQAPNADVVIPNHGEIPKGTLMSIVKMLAAIGVVIFIGFCYYSYILIPAGGN